MLNQKRPVRLARTRDGGMADEIHQPHSSRFVSRLDEYGPDGMDTERLLVPLRFLDEVVVAAKLLGHVGDHHGAAVGLVEKVGELLGLRATRKAQREDGIRLDGELLRLHNLLPKELAALFWGSDLGHIHLVAGDLATLTPSFKSDIAARFLARHLTMKYIREIIKPWFKKPVAYAGHESPRQHSPFRG